jgi:hypothetical protein
MKKIVTSLVVVGLLLVGLRADAQIKPTEAGLEKYKWKKRPLLLFSPSASNADYVRQKEILQAHTAGLAERDMMVIELVGQDKVYINGAQQKRQQSLALRKKFEVPAESFAAILVGKDGTEKSRYPEAVRMEEVFGLIDQMPMRRQEKGAE